jgi:hypothetical protein
VPLLLRQVEGTTNEFYHVGSCYVTGIMEEKAILGQLSDEWTRLSIAGDLTLAYAHDDGRRISQDPRLGPLPEGWKIHYYEGREMDKKGKMSGFWFEKLMNLLQGMILGCKKSI